MTKEISNINIKSNIDQFLNGQGKNKGRGPLERYASFDYCFNYFQTYRENGSIAELCSSEHMQTSCLHLAFYLASWGMFRGSSFLLERSVRHFEETVELIAKFDNRIWSIDVDKYTDENVGILLDFKKQLILTLGEKNRPSDTLVTKIMLGVFGNTPAFDGFFGAAFGIWTLGKRSQRRIKGFYDQNRVEIDSYKIPTFGFDTGVETKRLYTRAKIIDMIGFTEGQNLVE